MNSIGQKISNLRKSNNLSQQALANKLGVSDKTISKWENDNSMPDLIMLNSLVKIFKVPYEHFFEISSKEDLTKEYLVEQNENNIEYLDETLPRISVEEICISKKGRIKLSNKNMDNTDFSNPVFDKIIFHNFDIITCCLTNSNFKNKDFFNCFSKLCTLNKSTFENCNIDNSIFKHIDFTKANLNNCKFLLNKFTFTVFSKATLENVVFENIQFKFVVFSKTILKNINFKNCSFKRCTFYKSSFDNCKIEDCLFTSTKINKIYTDKTSYAYLMKATKAKITLATM